MIRVTSRQRIFVFLYLLFARIFFIKPLTAVIPNDTQEAKNDLRILELLPNLLCPLAVDPGIPADFVALSPNGILDPHDLIYWGPKDVLKAYFKDPSSLKIPLVRVKLSACVTQTGPNSFHKLLSFLRARILCLCALFYAPLWKINRLITRRSPVQVWLVPFSQPKQSQALKCLVVDEKVILN